MPKARYLDLLEKVKDATEKVTDEEMDNIFDELDELWDGFSDDEKDYLNGLDNSDF